MNDQRFVVTDAFWKRLEEHRRGKASDAGATAKDSRLFLEAVFWRVRTGSPWRDLPPCFRDLEQPVSAVPQMGVDRSFRESFQRNE